MKINVEEIAETLLWENVSNYVEHIQVKFEMPFVLCCWQDEKQLLRVSAMVSGCCEIPDEKHFNYDELDFYAMDGNELLSYGDMVRIFNVEYSGVEAGQI